MRQTFVDGVELTKDDLNRISSRLERQLYDRTLLKMMQDSYDRFFGDSFKVTYNSATEVDVAPGIGFQYDNTVSSYEPTIRMLYRAASVTKEVSAPHATFNRIDLICVKHARAEAETGTRKVKDLGTGDIATDTVEIATDWEADIVVTTGSATLTPVEPSVPAGYIKIAAILVTAVTGIADQAAITDYRTEIAYGPNMEIDTSAYVELTQSSTRRLKALLAEIDENLSQNRVRVSMSWNGTDVTKTVDVSAECAVSKELIWCMQDTDANENAQMTGVTIQFPAAGSVKLTFGADFPPASGTYYLVGR